MYCNGTLTFENKLKEKCGLACKLILTCCHCNWSEDYYTSKKLHTTKAGRKPFDINYRTVVAFRENGKGHSAIESGCGIMNLSPPMNKTAFKRIMVHLYNSYKKIAQENKSEVAATVRKLNLKEDFNEDEIVNTDASFDGTWQKRGFSLLNGVVIVIAKDTGKCIDYHVLSKNVLDVQHGKTEKMHLSMNGSLLIMFVI